MTLSKISHDLRYYFFIFERSYAVPYSCKFHTQGLPCSGFMMRGPFVNPITPSLFNVKKPTWLGLNYHSVGSTGALVFLAEVNAINQLQSKFSFCRSFNTVQTCGFGGNGPYRC